MDHHAKLDWASRHIDTLKKAMSDFVDDNPYHVVRNFDPQAKEHRASVVNVKPTPPDWSLMVGDIIHELRSALDIGQESQALREAYGLTLFGQSCLAARRLVPSGRQWPGSFWPQVGWFYLAATRMALCARRFTMGPRFREDDVV